ncbi:MAG: cyclopropane-fatty-acyl-phospholipid synthase family protein [Rhodothalassiaceae bacterium]
MTGEDRTRKAGRLERAGRSTLEWLLARLAGAEALYALGERHLVHGRLALILPDGSRRVFGGRRPGPSAEVEILRWRALGRMATGGALGFARSYIDGDWQSPDLMALCELASRNRETMGEGLKGHLLIRFVDRIRHLLRSNSRERARRNIAYHYDLGNDFYAAWLDASMTYSAGIFAEGDNSLEAAQARKYRRLLDLLGTRPGDRILEIGSGWGGFAEIAASERGADVTGLTLSESQLAYARERIARAGLEERVRFRLQDYRDETGSYDHIVSIEMFEAVGERYWPTYFRKIRECLKPGGRAALQIITIDEALFPAYRRGADFIQTYIFPGGMLAPMSALRREAAAAGLLWQDAQGFALGYAETLAAWRRRFEDAFRAGRLPQGFDESFRRIWNFYLAYCEGGFRGGSIDVQQIALERP